jgi:thiosulfate/3-mercaptopyruvate sulfurtransferase
MFRVLFRRIFVCTYPDHPTYLLKPGSVNSPTYRKGLFMRTAATILFLSCFTLLPAQTPRLVSTAWVGDHSKDADLVLVQVCQNRKEFANGHIPAARFLWWGYLSPDSPDESTALPSADDARKALEDLGISNSSRVILYGGPGVVTIVTRTFLMLEYLGMAEHTSILNGGLDAWKAEHRPVATGLPEAALAKGIVTVKVHPEFIVDVEYVKKNLRNPSVAIVDGRAKAAYDGRPGMGQKTGHIAGAKSVPFSSLVDSLNRFKSPDSLKKIFHDAGVNEGQKVVTYCWVGQQATVSLFAASLLGHDAALFDGSWEIWSAMDDSYPVETTPTQHQPDKKP